MLQFLTTLMLVGVAAAMPEVTEVMTDNNATQMLTIVQQLNDTRFLGGNPDGPYTLIVPVDSAFAKLDPAELTNIQTTPGLLDEIVGVHVLRGELFSWDLIDGKTIVSMNGHFVRIYKRGNSTYLNDAKVIKFDIEANGAVIILVDTVLDAPEGTIYEVLKKPEFGLTTTAELVDLVHLNTTLHRTVGPYTLFAPSEDAWNKLGDVILNQIKGNPSLLRQVISYHVHSGTLHLKSLDVNGTLSTLYRGHSIGVSVTGDIRLNNVAMLEEADIDCDNGVVHIIDHVLIPSSIASIIG